MCEVTRTAAHHSPSGSCRPPSCRHPDDARGQPLCVRVLASVWQPAPRSDPAHRRRGAVVCGMYPQVDAVVGARHGIAIGRTDRGDRGDRGACRVQHDGVELLTRSTTALRCEPRSEHAAGDGVKTALCGGRGRSQASRRGVVDHQACAAAVRVGTGVGTGGCGEGQRSGAWSRDGVERAMGS